MKSIGYTVKEELSQEAKNILEKLNNQEKLIDCRKSNFRRGNNVDYDFSIFRPLRELFRAIYYGEVLIPGAQREQLEFNNMFKLLKRYKPSSPKYVKSKQNLLIKAQNFYDGREMIINAFKGKIFPLNDLSNYPQYSSEEDTSPSASDSDSEYIPKRDKSPDKTFDFSNKDLNELLVNMGNELDLKIVKKHFCYNS